MDMMTGGWIRDEEREGVFVPEAGLGVYRGGGRLSIQQMED